MSHEPHLCRSEDLELVGPTVSGKFYYECRECGARSSFLSTPDPPAERWKPRQLSCFQCGKTCSTFFQAANWVLRGTVECPECIAKRAANERGALDRIRKWAEAGSRSELCGALSPTEAIAFKTAIAICQREVLSILNEEHIPPPATKPHSKLKHVTERLDTLEEHMKEAEGHVDSLRRRHANLYDSVNRVGGPFSRLNALEKRAGDQEGRLDDHAAALAHDAKGMKHVLERLDDLYDSVHRVGGLFSRLKTLEARLDNYGALDDRVNKNAAALSRLKTLEEQLKDVLSSLTVRRYHHLDARMETVEKQIDAVLRRLSTPAEPEKTAEEGK